MQPQFIVMETRGVFVSKPSLMAWIKTAFPLGGAKQGQLHCPYLLMFWAYPRAPQAPLSSPVCTPPVLGTSSWSQHRGALYHSPNPSHPRTPHQNQPGLKHIFIDPPMSLPSSPSSQKIPRDHFSQVTKTTRSSAR